MMLIERDILLMITDDDISFHSKTPLTAVQNPFLYVGRWSWCDSITANHRKPTQEEQEEVKSIIFKRMSEVRDAIFKVG
jgi:hypothetical protein